MSKNYYSIRSDEIKRTGWNCARRRDGNQVDEYVDEETKGGDGGEVEEQPRAQEEEGGHDDAQVDAQNVAHVWTLVPVDAQIFARQRN